jgi:hypothetical protein
MAILNYSSIIDRMRDILQENVSEFVIRKQGSGIRGQDDVGA